jgi:hypothetical protein
MNTQEYYYQEVQYYQEPQSVRCQEQFQQESVYNNPHDTYRPIKSAPDITLRYQKFPQYVYDRYPNGHDPMYSAYKPQTYHDPMYSASKPPTYHDPISVGPKPQTYSQAGHMNYNPDYQSQGWANETNMFQYHKDQKYAQNHYYEQEPK